MHNDGPADVVSLLCLAPASVGGDSHWASSTSVYNRILARRPDLLEVLAGPWFFDRKGEVPPGKQPFFEIPVLNFHAGYLSVNFSANYYAGSQRHEEVPRLTPAHLEVRALFVGALLLLPVGWRWGWSAAAWAAAAHLHGCLLAFPANPCPALAPADRIPCCCCPLPPAPAAPVLPAGHQGV